VSACANGAKIDEGEGRNRIAARSNQKRQMKNKRNHENNQIEAKIWPPKKVLLSEKTDEKAFGNDNATIFWWRKSRA